MKINHKVETIETSHTLPIPSKESVTSYVYIPTGIPAQELPLVVYLAPWLSCGKEAYQWKPFRTSLFERIDQLIETQQIPPVAVAAVDLFTSFGGSQYIDSSYFGQHGTLIARDVMGDLQNALPVSRDPRQHYVMGRSSGGFGALRLMIDFPEVFQGGGAIHSGDMGFETTLKPSLIDLCQFFEKRQKNPTEFLSAVSSSPKPSYQELHVLMLLGLCGFYSPSASNPLGFDLPIDLKSGKIDSGVWKKWLAHDPVEFTDDRLLKLNQLSKVYIDCGSWDQYHLQFGARQLCQRLQELGVPFCYEEFPDNHSATEYRYDISLAYLLNQKTPKKPE